MNTRLKWAASTKPHRVAIDATERVAESGSISSRRQRSSRRDRIQAEADRDEARQSKADLDYLARELAAIRTSLGEVVTPDTGRLVALGDTEALGRAMREATLLDRSAVRDHAVACFGLDRMVSAYEDLYEQVAA